MGDDLRGLAARDHAGVPTVADDLAVREAEAALRAWVAHPALFALRDAARTVLAAYDLRGAEVVRQAIALRNLRHDAEVLRELAEQDAHHLALLLMREQAVRTAWTGLTAIQRRFDVPAELTAEIVELVENLDGSSRTERELAEQRDELVRLRAIVARVEECTNEHRTVGPISSHYILTGTPYGQG